MRCPGIRVVEGPPLCGMNAGRGGPPAECVDVRRRKRLHGNEFSRRQPAESIAMDDTKPNLARQVAEAASEFQEQRTGHAPKAVTVVLSQDTLVITLHGALSPAEKALAASPEGAAKVQEFHRQLFTTSAEPLRQEIKRITGVAVREAIAEVEPATGSVVQVFTTGTMVQVFLLARDISSEAWSGSEPVPQV